MSSTLILFEIKFSWFCSRMKTNRNLAASTMDENVRMGHRVSHEMSNMNPIRLRDPRQRMFAFFSIFSYSKYRFVEGNELNILFGAVEHKRNCIITSITGNWCENWRPKICFRVKTLKMIHFIFHRTICVSSWSSLPYRNHTHARIIIIHRDINPNISPFAECRYVQQQ